MERIENEFNFTFDGAIDSIEVSSLTSSLLSLNSLIKEINREAGTNKKIELTVKTYKPGSFDVYLQLVADAVAIGSTAGLFAGNNIEAAKQVIDLALSTLNLKKFLGGQKPKQVISDKNDKVRIEDNHGNVFIADTLVFELSSNNEQIDKIVSSVFKPIKSADGVTGISIKDYQGRTQFEVKKNTNSFEDMISPNPIVKEIKSRTRDEEVDDAVLAVYGIVFDNEKQWEFYFQGNKIPVRLLDGRFLDKVMNRTYHFANGDRIRCKLVKHQVFNKTAMVFENKSYSILEVYGKPIPPAPQGNIEFDDETPD